VYETNVRPGYLLGAAGTVTFDYNVVRVRLDGPAESVVLKFRWARGLFTVPPVRLEPVVVGPETQFIRAYPGPVTRFEIRF
jgi:hypothetical protein